MTLACFVERRGDHRARFALERRVSALRTRAQSSAPIACAHGRHAIDARRRHQQAQRGRDARARRTDDARDAEPPRHLAAVQRPAAAGREQRELACVMPALGDVHARRRRHVLVDDRVDAPRELRDRKLRPASASGAIAASRRARSIAHRAAGKRRRIEKAEHEVGVGHGRHARRRARSTPARAPRPRCAAPP